MKVTCIFESAVIYSLIQISDDWHNNSSNDSFVRERREDGKGNCTSLRSYLFVSVRLAVAGPGKIITAVLHL